MTAVSSQKLVASALARLERIQKTDAFDPTDLSSRPTAAQQEVIDDFGKVKLQWIAAANRSGKSATAARLIGWALTDTHPSWRVPERWKSEGLLIVVAARTGKHIENTLWPKIRACLEPGSYKEVRTGNALQHVEFYETDNRIVFQSLENPSTARERLQSYDAHIVWLDELVDLAQIISEISLRVTTKGGQFIASFTPLVPAPAVKRMVDSATLPLAKKYVFKTLDNPVFHDPEKRAQLMASFAGVPPSEVRTRLEGEWIEAEAQVYHFDYEKMVEFPEGYSPLWRHVEAVDPALKSALGLTLWAENPDTGVWYCILSEYIKGIYVPTDLVRAVQEKVRNFNIIKRIADPHEVWYIQTANSMGLRYVGIYKKNDRKSELIKRLQEYLGTRVLLSPHCEGLICELQECRWADGERDRIVNASSYHLLDAAQYFCDEMPPPEKDQVRASSRDDYLYQMHHKNELKREMVKKKAEKKAEMTQIRRGVVRRRPGVWGLRRV